MTRDEKPRKPDKKRPKRAVRLDRRLKAEHIRRLVRRLDGEGGGSRG